MVRGRWVTQRTSHQRNVPSIKAPNFGTTRRDRAPSAGIGETMHGPRDSSGPREDGSGSRGSDGPFVSRGVGKVWRIVEAGWRGPDDE